jgi:uncharacterized spore protein YtfJ
MTTMLNDVAEEARRAATGAPANRLAERLAETVGARASVAAVFGEPIRAGDLTVVPVAKVRWGFGGGGGQSDVAAAAPASGSGGGGGVAAGPVGYIKINPDGATFHPISDPRPSPTELLAWGIALGIVIRAVSKLAGR